MIPGSATPFLLAQSGADSDYKIDRSLRFNSGDSAYLNRTPSSAGNRKTWTWSGWVKLSTASGANNLFAAYNGSSYAVDNFIQFYIDGNSGRLSVYGSSLLWSSEARLRDPSAWYHIVIALDTTQSTADDRLKVYINGVQTGKASGSGFTQNEEYAINNTIPHRIGTYSGSTEFFNGLMADVHFIDGQALAASNFGEFDSKNVWQPKKYTGGYDVTGGTTVAAATGAEPILNTTDDFGKTISSGVRTDSNSSYIVLAAPLNGANGGTTITDYHHTVKGSGSAKTISIYTGSASGGAVTSTAQDKYYGSSFYAVRGATNNYSASDYIYRDSDSDLDLGTGSFCVEFWYYPTSLTSNSGIFDNRHPSTSWPNDANGFALITTGNGSIFSYSGGNQIINHSSKLTVGQWHHIAYTRDGSTERLFVNGDFFSSTASSSRNYNRQRFYLGTTANNGEGSDGYYSDLRIYKGAAKYTANFTVPDKPAGGVNQFHLKFDDNSSNAALGTDSSGDSNTWTVNNITADVPSGNAMAAVTYTGNASTQAVSGLGFQPDFVWLKRRDGTGNNNIQDVVRGASAVIQSDSNTAEFSNGPRLASFDSDGFTLTSDNGGNTSGGSYVAWAWRAGGTPSNNTDGSITSSVSVNTSYGFSIVSYTGTGSGGATVGHGLGAAPKFILFKNRTDNENWFAWHNSLSSPDVRGLYLDLTADQQNFGSTSFNNTVPSSSVITLGTANIVNGSSNNMIAYCWSEVAGFSKFGSYTGNGSTSGPTITTGFKPKMILLKASTVNGEDWVIMDTARAPSNPSSYLLSPNSASQEYNNGVYNTDILATGFQIKNNNPRWNQNGATYIYAAFAEKLDQSAIDSLIDTPTNYTATPNSGGNYATLNPLDTIVSLTNGNLETNTSSGWQSTRATFGMSSGKFYWETQNKQTAAALMGIAASTAPMTSGLIFGSDANPAWTWAGANRYFNGTSAGSASLANHTASDIVMYAFDADSGDLWFGRNGTWYDSSWGTTGNPASGANPTVTGLDTSTTYLPAGSFVAGAAIFNFGQRPFAYTPPTGYKSLCTTNLDDPLIADASTVFDAKLWTGDGNSTRSISNYSFSPDFVWIKNRTTAGWQHVLYDQIRGAGTSSVTKSLSTDSTRAEASGNDTNHGYLSGFTSNGFDLTKGSQSSGDYVNHNNWAYVGWAWDAGSSTSSNTDGSITSSVRANPSAGFSIVTGTQDANNTLNTFGHGLNAEPHMVILKRRNGAEDWYVYHKELGNTSRIQLNSTSAVTTGSGVWGSTTPTSSVFTIQSFNAGDFVAYCFAPVEGYSAFGSYTGNGSDDGPFVYTGFRPAFVLTKAYSSNSNNNNNWNIHDTSRDPFNEASEILSPTNAGAALDNAHTGIDILSNGFKLKADTNGQSNYSGWDYIYAAFAEHPFKTARAR